MKAVTLGGAMIDTIAIIDTTRIEKMTMANAASSFLLLAEGHKTEALEISTSCGGGAINSAVAMARLGHDVAALVKLGQDARAETILQRLMEENVSARFAVRDGRLPTGASVLVSSHDQNAAIFTFRGANTLLEPGDLKADAFSADLVYIASLSNKSADCFGAIVASGKRGGAFVATNPGVRQLSSRGGAFEACLPLIDLLCINRVEADVLVPSLVAKVGEGGPKLSPAVDEDVPELAIRGLMSGGYAMSLKAFVSALTAMGVARVLITDGRNGAFLADKASLLYCPGAKVKVAGTAGAGDAIGATLASSLVEGRGAEWALKAATLNASSVVGFVDTQSGLLRADALVAQMKSQAGALKIQRWAM